MSGPRILGLETEYGLVVLGPDYTPEQAAMHLFRFRPARYRGDNLFLTNGSRLYLDIGSHPEYATAECSTVKQLVGADRAGEELLRDMAHRANENWKERGIDARIHLIKNNADSAGNTFGCHENYSFPRAVDSAAFLPVLTSFLAVRICLAGAGTALPLEGGGWQWAFSVRAQHMVATTSADPTKERALINTRDEPHADASKWRRLHVISGDTNISEAATAMKVGLTASLLDLLEDGVDLSDLVLADPIDAMSRCNVDAFAPLELANGTLISARELLDKYIERIWACSDLASLGEWKEPVQQLTYDALAALDSPEGQKAAADRLDWALKRELIEGMQQRGPISLDAYERFDLAYHDLSATKGLGARLRSAGIMQTWLDEEQLALAYAEAPDSTRAGIRGRFLEAALAKQADFAVTWSQIRLDSPPRTPVDLPDPFATHCDEAQKLTNYVWEHAERLWIDAPGKDGLGAPG